ncbi:MAG: type 4a pilus biogenesis protein PilO [Pirellulales bacterium]|nr:type 4a pilus biogenesis protein PilO [Pirellulales bacterium]
MAKKSRLHSWYVTLPLAGAAGVYVFFIHLPAEKAIGQSRDQMSQMQGFCARSDTIAVGLHSTRRQLAKTREYTDAWREAAPTRDQLSGVMGRITQLAQESGVRITRFDPEPILQRETISEFPFVVGCRGTFSEIFQFLRQIEGLPEEVWVNRLQLGKEEKKQATISCEVNLVIFMDNPGYSGHGNLSE